MEQFQELLASANKSFKIADHLTYITYPLVNDIKLIITILDNLHKALISGMDALLYYEYLYKRLSFMPGDFNSKIEVFKSYCIPRYNIARESLVLVGDINRIVEHRRNSPTEFVRSGKYVMCTSDYKMRVLNFDKVKNYTMLTRGFIDKLNGILK